MYRILLDSSNRDLAIGIGKEKVLIDSIQYEAWQRQSEYMIPELNRLLKKHHIDRSEIEGVVVSIGPGSYTGVRIALTIAKVMSLALSCPLYTVSSLQILRKKDNPSVCLMNARSQRSYIGIYQGKQTILRDTIWKNDEVLQFLKEHPQYAVCGDVSYLGLEGEASSVLEEMLALSYEKTPIENPLGLTPVYLKDHV